MADTFSYLGLDKFILLLLLTMNVMMMMVWNRWAFYIQQGNVCSLSDRCVAAVTAVAHRTSTKTEVPYIWTTTFSRHGRKGKHKSHMLNWDKTCLDEDKGQYLEEIGCGLGVGGELNMFCSFVCVYEEQQTTGVAVIVT